MVVITEKLIKAVVITIGVLLIVGIIAGLYFWAMG